MDSHKEAKRADEHTLQQRIIELEQRVHELEQSEAEVSALFAAMSDVILVLDSDGQYLKIAPTNPSLLYKPSEEMLGKTIHDIMPAEAADVFVGKIRHALETHQIVHIEYFLPVQGGDVWFAGSVSPINDTTVLWVARDVTERKKAEEQRRTMQDKIIQMQAATLAELSTPLIPISDRVLVMPLIGTIDTRRAQNVLDTLLHGIAEKQAEVVILDVTGVVTLDSQVADTLLKAAQAVQLLGARVVLTGIRPEVAQMLVGLGIDFSNIITRSTLQSGITYVLEH